MLFPVDDHSGDLLVHKYEDGDQQRRKRGCQVHPPGVPPKRRDEPAPLGICGLEKEEEREKKKKTKGKSVKKDFQWSNLI